jgi:hypothetical protein
MVSTWFIKAGATEGKRMKIYLSSTYEDLKDHRRTVFDALRQSGYKVIAMEDYVARDAPRASLPQRRGRFGHLCRHLWPALRLCAAT